MTKAEQAALLRQKGVCPTPMRLAVYGFVCEHPIHPTADAVFCALQPEHPSLSRMTVYNTLHLLAEAGLLCALPIEPTVLHYDAQVQPHGHFRCEKCGAILDFALPELPTAAELPAGCRPSRCDVFYSGLCAKCSE